MGAEAILKEALQTEKKQVLSGIFWNVVQFAINIGFTVLVRFVLARMLFPEQFGLVGMATVFTGFVQVLNDLGIAAALVQRKEELLRPVHYHTAFWTGVVWAAGIYLIMVFGVAPLAASFYSEPELLRIIPVMSLGILISPVNLVHKAQLTKRMDFKKIALITNTATVISGSLALLLAFLGAGVWALVVNSVATFFVAMPLYFRATRWRPEWIWEKRAFREIFGFGMYTTGTNVVNYAIGNSDYLLIGRLVSAPALGAYTLAFELTDMFRSKLMTIMNNVMYPLYGKKQDDPAAVKTYYLNVIRYNSIVVYPVMLLFLVLGEPLVLGLFGERWQEAVTPLRILSVAVMVHMLVNSNTALIRGMGKPDLEMKLQLFKAALFIPSLAGGVYFYGLPGAAWAVLVNKVIAVIIAQYTFDRFLSVRIGTGEFLGSVKVPWVASAVTCVFIYVLYNHAGVHYLCCVAVLPLCYFTAVWRMMRGELKTHFQQLKGISNRKSRC